MNNEQIRKAIYIRAIGRLAARDYSRKGLETQLITLTKRYPRNKLYPLFTPAAVQSVIKELVEHGLINEERAVRNAIESSMSGNYGLRRIRLKLTRKGYPGTLVDSIIKEVQPSGRDFERIEETVKRKYEQLKRKAGDDRKKIFQITLKLKSLLFNRGFSIDEINAIIGKIKK